MSIVQNEIEYFKNLIEKYKLSGKVKLFKSDEVPVLEAGNYDIFNGVDSLIKVHGSLNYMRCHNCGKIYLIDKYSPND